MNGKSRVPAARARAGGGAGNAAYDDEQQSATAPPPSDVLDTGRAGGLVMRGAVLRVAGYVAGSLLAIISAVLLTRHLGVSRFGQYTTIVSVATLATSVTDVGLTNLATREYSVMSGEHRDGLMRDLLGLRVVVTSLAVVAATLFAVVAGYSPSRVIATFLAAIGLGLASLQALLAVPLLARLRLGWVSALELLRQATLVLLTVVLVLAGAGLIPLLAALVPSSLVALLATMAVIRGDIPMRPSVRPRAALRLVRATLVFSLATSLATIYPFTTQIITSLTTNAHQTGLFAASFRVFAVVAAAGGLAISSAFPLLARAARDDHERLAFAMQRLFDVAVILGMGAALTAVTGAQPIIRVIAGPRYAGSVPVLRIEGAALLASFILAAWGYALISLRKHTALLAANAAALSITAALAGVLASSHGAQGAAVAIVGGEWTLAAWYLISLGRGDTRLRPGMTGALKVAAAAVPAFAVMLLGLPEGWQLVLALAVYAAGIALLRAVPRELFEMLPSRRAV